MERLTHHHVTCDFGRLCGMSAIGLVVVGVVIALIH